MVVSFASIISEKHNLKRLKKNEKNIFTIYSPKKAITEEADFFQLIQKFQSN